MASAFYQETGRYLYICLCSLMQLQTTSISGLLSVFWLAFVPRCVYPSKLCVRHLQCFSCLVLCLEKSCGQIAQLFQIPNGLKLRIFGNGGRRFVRCFVAVLAGRRNTPSFRQPV